MKIPDGNKPIRVGDTSFIYKGVYHPINWLGKDPYRPRVEMLVIKDRQYLYARLKDDIEKTPSDKRKYKYAIPGGSVDPDSTMLDQAIAETNEEALINVALVYHSGIQYYDKYEEGFILKGGDMPLEYVGSVSDVYVGVYDGEYDKSKVEEKDLDEDMATNGKFHDIVKIARYLRKEHVEALARCQFLNQNAKTALMLYRSDIISESISSPIKVNNEKNEIYHGSVHEIETFQPMSLDLGNAFDKPGWSTFCFGDYDHAKLFGASRALTKLFEEFTGTDENPVGFVNGKLVMNRGQFERLDNDLYDIKAKFFVYTIDSTNLNLGIGNDPALQEYTFRESNVPPKKIDEFNLSLVDLKELIEVVDEDVADMNQPRLSEYANLLSHNYQTERIVRERLQAAVTKGILKPGDDIEEFMAKNDLEFESDDIHLPNFTIDNDEAVFESIIPVLEKKEYPKNCYGLPDRKAYPMPDEKHVRSAIRFFNYAKKDEEKQLAEAINKQIRKFKMTDIKVGKKNRFKKYYKPISESVTLNEFVSTMDGFYKIASSESASPKKKYRAYTEAQSLVQEFVMNLESGVYENIDEDVATSMIQKSYAALAEIAMNQIELMTTMESKDVRTLALYPIMEADKEEDDTDDKDGEETEGAGDDGGDEPEGATDYTAMADEQGADGDEEGDGEDGATDYTAMADEQGAEDDEGADGADAGDEPTDDGGADEEDTGDGEDDEGVEDEATDYTAMADDQGAEGTDEGEGEEGTDDTNEEGGEDSTSSEGDETSENSEDGDGNTNRYDNKEIKNYFLLNSYLSLHQTVIDVLDTVNGVVLSTPEANGIMAKVVKNLQDVKSFVEKFIQFQFNEKDYAWNLYYYNLLISVLRLNLKLFETATSVSGSDASKK